MAADVQTRRARAGLLRLCEPPAQSVVSYLDQVGAVEAFENIIAGTAPPAVLGATAARRADQSADSLRVSASQDLERAQAVGGRLICPEDDDWPTAAFVGFALAQSRGAVGSAPPLALYVRGTGLVDLPESGVTIVGARACSPYGGRVAMDIAGTAVRAGLAVVSGGAFGVDAAAHRAALAQNGFTYAVLACGIDRYYPVANSALLGAVTQSGAVISEYSPGTTPARHRFLVRNRLLAALGMATVVVEAGRRSGSLSTASAAGLLGRTILAVPGSIESAMSAGCHLLLKDGFAQLVSTADDVVQTYRGLNQEGLFSAAQASAEFDPRHPTDGLDTAQTRVYEALALNGGRTVGELAVESGIEGRQVLSTLPVLEMLGLVRKSGAKWYRATPSTGKI